MQNQRDAFSHSLQCDGFLSTLSDIIGGVAHVKCQCWCHNAQHLFATPEPEYDLTPPPEYASSADLAFVLDEPAHVRVGCSNVQPEIIAAELGAIESAVVLDSRLNKIEACLYSSEQFPNRSPQELTSGKCDTCGDTLKDCECVE